ncbi:DUF4097 family beta strand repeat-containing protein [Clostridium sp. D33t1_170424_F3]|uniref:DUF4097 family beta strand repeat-containing protein n=1 Tax=Clostridium sp. D33t1_170424_F3 TaxID=2787099 RepID=UPI0018AB2340|nr:DUF4097 family beta strand repeat-containing protein [Clostridium sp. D33t1_170424_F3]
MSKTAAKVIIGIWSVILVFCIAVFAFLCVNDGWGNRWFWHSSRYNGDWSYVQLREQRISENVDSLDIDWKGGDVIFYESDDSTVKIVQRGVKNTPEEEFFNFSVSNGKLKIQDGKRTAGLRIFPFSFSIGSDLDVYLPQKTYQTLAVRTIGGDVSLQEFNASVLELSSTSGDLSVSGEYTEMTLESTSGDLECSAVQTDRLEFQTVSGEALFKGRAGQINANSTSGDLSFKVEEMPESVSAHTVSGEIIFALPENDGFSVEFHSVSGDLYSDFWDRTDRYNTQYKDGGTQFDLSTTSGDVRIHKR